jgi:ketosteroid isomerase-like protein
MGEARDVTDQLTAALITGDLKQAAALHAEDVVSMGPNLGEVTGRDAAVHYMAGLWETFPDATYELVHAFEDGDTAIDEGIVTGTHTEPMPMEGEDPVPPTGKRVTFRVAEVVTVRDGLVTSHRFYFDQLAILQELGIVQSVEGSGGRDVGQSEQGSRAGQP